MVQQSAGPGSPSGTGGASRGTGVSGGVVATLAGGGLLVVFMVQNTDPVTLKFLFWSFTWPLWLFTLTVALLGAIVWLGLGGLPRPRRRGARRGAPKGRPRARPPRGP